VTGNADYTIDEPMHYPFAKSENALLQWINNQLVKAKPEMHRKTFLKPFHRTEEFCSTCHKVNLPFALNHYKDWLRGQNHYDPFLLSGQSGHGARSFYYPDKAKDRCSDCHMPLAASNDFGARDFDKSGSRKIHNHFFFGANTGLPFLRNFELLQEAARTGASESDVRASTEFRENEEIARAHADFLRDGQMRIDIFALRAGGTIEGDLVAPLRPSAPRLQPGSTYLVEVVLRTLKLGHVFTQGTADSNEVWVDFEATAGGRVIGRSGALDEVGRVDPWAHFVNALVIDRKGNRIDRRNPQDIYVPVYNHQIPPGAGQVVHFLLEVPAGITDPIQLTAKLQYRKFDRTYMEHVYRDEKVPIPNLPITTMCEDRVTLGIEGGSDALENTVVKIPEWQRWNDYGIGLFLEGEDSTGSEKGELRQAEMVFKKVVELGQGEGHANLARIYVREKRLADAVAALQAAAQNTDMVPFATAGPGPGQTPGIATEYVKPAAPWVVAWVTGLVNRENGQLDEAIKNFELIVSDAMYEAVRDRGFDFRRDYLVWNQLGLTRSQRAEQARGPKRAGERERFVRAAVDAFQHTLRIDPEDFTAHFNLKELYGILADRELDSSQEPDTASEPPNSPVNAASLQQWARQVADSQMATDSRIEAARQLASTIRPFLAMPRDRFESRLATIVDLLRQIEPVFYAEPSTASELTKALANVLHKLHGELHAIYKPDDNARAAVTIHRKNNSAANHAAQSIVIYPLNRDGAPGLANSHPPPANKPVAGGGE
jgi:tetratricopeptide (TPR) repeat protein